MAQLCLYAAIEDIPFVLWNRRAVIPDVNEHGSAVFFD